MSRLNRSIRAALALSLAGGMSLAVAGDTASQTNQSIYGTAIQYDPAQRPAHAQAEIFVELELPALAKLITSGAEKSAQQSHRKAIEQQQAQFRRHLTELKSGTDFDLTETGSAQIALNGINFWGSTAAVDMLKSLPGVKRVEVLPRMELALNNSVPWIGADTWQAMLGDGSGVRVGVIDSGIDFTHAALGGSGNPAEFFAMDPDAAPPESLFPNDVVRGGIDLVGGDWDPCNPDPDLGVLPPKTDPNPLDFNGHGTHVAGTIAGQPVGDLGVGVAPGAEIYAVKVGADSGCPSLTNIIPAVEWTLTAGTGNIDNRMDVVNMSLGSNWGNASTAYSNLIDNATDLGMIFVVAAGNAGNVEYIMGAPAAARSAISVGASFPGGRTAPVMAVDTDAEDVPEAMIVAEGTSPVRLADGAIEGEVVLASPELACDGVDNPGELDGRVALVSRGECTFAAKSASVEAAGAIAMIVANNDEAAPNSRITMAGLDGAGIASVMISFNDGDALANALRTDPVNVVLSDELTVPVTPELDDAMAGFSSRGPGAGGSLFKPDVTAPGVGIRAAGTASGTGAASLSGTSMATPHVAGITALLLEQNPNLTAEQVRALLQNSADPSMDNDLGVPFPLAKQGTGVVNVERIMANTAHTIPAGVSFGRMAASDSQSVTRTVTVFNTSDSATTFEIEPVFRARPLGVSLNVPESISVPANGSASFDVTLTQNAANSVFIPTPQGPLSNMDPGFMTQTEADGWLFLHGDDQMLTMGMLAVVDPASNISASATSSAVTFSNPGNAAGEIAAFTLAGGQGLLLDGAPRASSIRGLGYRTRQVPTGPQTSETWLDLLVAANGAWEGASTARVFIDVDTSGDGEADKLIQVADLGNLQGAGFNGLVVSALFDLETGSGSLQQVVNIDHNNASMVASVRLADLLPEGQAQFAGELVMANWAEPGSVDALPFQIDLTERADFGAYNGFFLGGNRSLEVARGDNPASIWRLRNNRPDSEVVILD